MTEVLLGLFSGIAFGFVIQRVGATNPDKMARAHLMIEPYIPQFMLTAVALSAVGLYGLRAVDIGRTMVLPTSIVATGVAAIVFGIGWGLTGYCPGTSWAAAGEGRLDALVALAGGLAGAGVFAHLHEFLVPRLYDPTNIGQVTLGDWLCNDLAGLLVLVGLFVGGTWAIGKIWGARHAPPGL